MRCGAPISDTQTGQLRVLADEHAGRAGVVEMDVGEQQVLDVAELVPALGEPALQRGDAGRRPAVEEGEAAGRLEQVDADRPGRARVERGRSAAQP